MQVDQTQSVYRNCQENLKLLESMPQQSTNICNMQYSIHMIQTAPNPEGLHHLRITTRKENSHFSSSICITISVLRPKGVLDVEMYIFP